MYEDRPEGIVVLQHRSWTDAPTRHAFVLADLSLAVRTRDRLASLFDYLAARGRAEGALTLMTDVRETDRWKIELVTSIGYREDRRYRLWELDLVDRRAQLLAWAEDAREKMGARGFEMRTLAEVDDPTKYEQMWRGHIEAEGDVPTTLPITPPSLADYRDRLRRPGIYEDRIWVAMRDGEIVGTSYLEYPSGTHVGTAWTGTLRRVRGQGVARALKLETIAQAIALGVPRVRTGNDAANAPILHINEALGYRSIPGGILFLKDIST
jgi:GNAT superfamily N-acetyltransferase